ncbi:hypothetical protein KIW84_043157 [Lathyrus oleraceus]|uniref:Uncharacterized protein n=1 Tax=Pisum sativum TaxID=3888 RepID=A0A9D4XEG8_PEA|nr:hypothetical protein KIW84_043157 [Pisum sativum]
MAPDRDQLRAMSQRWRELAAQIMPPLEEKEMTKIFLKTLSSFYYERMISSAPSDFTEMVNMGMRLEEGVSEGRLAKDEGSSAKLYGAFAKKKEEEAHAVSSHVKRRPSVKRKTVRPASNQHQVYQPRNNNNTSTSYDRKRVSFDPIPMTYTELYPSLIERKLITPHDPPAVLANPQWWNKPELHCVYHSGAPGHDVENCYPLKTKVQDLVRSGILFFEDVGPNVKKNPLPEHGKSAVNMVQGCPGKYKVRYVSHIRQSLVEMHRLLCGYSHYEHDHDRCRVCTVNERGCRQVRKDIQDMLDQGVIEMLQNRDEDEVNVISPVFRIPEPVVVRYHGSKKKVSPSLIIKPAGPFPYSSDKVVPYRYNAVALEDGKEVHLPSISVVSILDVSVVKGVNPAVVVRAPVPVGQQGILKEGCDEMLRLIKRSEYNVVDQLLQTPSKIFVLSLLMNYKPHRKALQRVLDVAYMDHDVTIE